MNRLRARYPCCALRARGDWDTGHSVRVLNLALWKIATNRVDSPTGAVLAFNHVIMRWQVERLTKAGFTF